MNKARQVSAKAEDINEARYQSREEQEFFKMMKQLGDYLIVEYQDRMAEYQGGSKMEGRDLANQAFKALDLASYPRADFVRIYMLASNNKPIRKTNKGDKEALGGISRTGGELRSNRNHFESILRDAGVDATNLFALAKAVLDQKFR